MVMPQDKGVLYVVATPIGNLRDMSARAQDILGAVALVAAEDTRHSRKLLAHFGIDATLVALHEHNEEKITVRLLKALAEGKDVALISDAGTPLVSDPGFYLVRAARRAGIRTVPVPGASACIAALSVSGLPTDRFVFEGFLPARQAARRQRLEVLKEELRTLVFYESSHRIQASIQDMAAVFGSSREAVIARELTKTFETVKHGTLSELLDWLAGDSQQLKGEFVVLVHGMPDAEATGIDREAERVLALLMETLPLKQAAALAAKISGQPKNRLYEYGLTLKERES